MQQVSLPSEGAIVRTRWFVTALLACTALVMAIGLSACSSGALVPNATGSSPTAAPASAFSAAAYKRYGISLLYPRGWVSAASGAKSGGARGPLLELMWGNPKGKVSDGHLIDALSVTVFALNRPVQPEAVTRQVGSFKIIAYDLVKALPELYVTDPPKLVTINGTRGIELTYTFGLNGTATGAMSYLLPKGHYAYWVTGQSSAATWLTSWSKLGPAMASFTIRPEGVN
jgi:hypothetical protein